MWSVYLLVVVCSRGRFNLIFSTTYDCVALDIDGHWSALF